MSFEGRDLQPWAGQGFPLGADVGENSEKGENSENGENAALFKKLPHKALMLLRVVIVTV